VVRVRGGVKPTHCARITGTPGTRHGRACASLDRPPPAAGQRPPRESLPCRTGPRFDGPVGTCAGKLPVSRTRSSTPRTRPAALPWRA